MRRSGQQQTTIVNTSGEPIMLKACKKLCNLLFIPNKLLIVLAACYIIENAKVSGGYM